MSALELDDGYPTEADERIVAAWPFGEFRELMECIRQAWHFGDWGWAQELTTNDCGDEIVRYSISTGGWSGNETLIGALQDNYIFWSTCWQSSRRGGHYVFEVKV